MENTQHTFILKKSEKISLMPPDLALWLTLISLNFLCPENRKGTWLVSQGSWVRYPTWQHTFVSSSACSRRAVVCYWRKYVHEVLVNRLGGLSLPRKSVVRLTDRPDMTLDVYRGRKTTMQQQQKLCPEHIFMVQMLFKPLKFYCTRIGYVDYYN